MSLLRDAGDLEEGAQAVRGEVGIAQGTGGGGEAEEFGEVDDRPRVLLPVDHAEVRPGGR